MDPMPVRRMGSRLLAVATIAVSLVFSTFGRAEAFHFYRGTSSGCSAVDGAISDDGSQTSTAAATVLMLHNSFHDTATGGPITVVHAGDTVRWTWNSAHCHSVQGPQNAADAVVHGYNDNQFQVPSTFYSGFHYPTTEPTSPHVIPGFFDYPVPELSPTLSYSHTFGTPGVYAYRCEHHYIIGMVGMVIVLPPE